MPLHDWIMFSCGVAIGVAIGGSIGMLIEYLTHPAEHSVDDMQYVHHASLIELQAEEIIRLQQGLLAWKTRVDEAHQQQDKMCQQCGWRKAADPTQQDRWPGGHDDK